VVVDSPDPSKAGFSIRSVTIYTLGEDFTDPAWATKGNQFTLLPAKFNPEIFPENTRIWNFDFDTDNFNYAVLNLRSDTIEFTTSLELS
jgi:hypothetical protein